MSKMKKMRSQHPPPFFVCDDQNLWNSALPQPATLKKKILASQIIHGWYVYIYIYAQPPPKQKTQKTKKKKHNHGDCRISNGFGFFVFVFWFSPRGPPQRVSIFFWFKDVFKFSARFTVNSPKRIRILLCYVVFLFVWRCTYEYVQLAKKSEHQKWTCYIVNHSTNSMSGGRGWGDDHMCIYIYIITAYICIYTHTVYVELIATTVWYLHSPTSKLVWKQLLSANCIYIYIYTYIIHYIYIG